MSGVRTDVGRRGSNVSQAADQADNFFLAGSLLFPYVTPIYPPLDLDLMLVFFGVLFFVALTIAVFLDRRARKHQDIEILKRVYAGFIPLPWILAASIFLNGRLDAPGKVAYVPAQVQGKFLMKGLVRGSRRLVVHSWRPDQSSSACRGIRIILTASRWAIESKWPSSRECWESRGCMGVSRRTAAGVAWRAPGLRGRLAVGQQGNL